MAGELSWLAPADGASPWAQAQVVVAGIGVSGFAAADGLLEFGARVTVLDDTADQLPPPTRPRCCERSVGGAPGSRRRAPCCPRRRPGGHHRLAPRRPAAGAAAASGIRIWSELELAWRLSRPPRSCPGWASPAPTARPPPRRCWSRCSRAAGLRTAAVGNIGRPVMETVLDPEPYDVLAVELSSHQLHWSHSLSLHSAVVLNLQPDHFEWHGGLDGYRDAKASIYERVQVACVYNVADPATERMVEEADVIEGARAIGFTLGIPGLSMLGVVDDLLVDRAFIEQRADSALELATLTTSPRRPRTTWPTPWPRPPSPGPTACGPPRSGTACARSPWAPTRSRPSRRPVASAGSTTPRRPTRMRRMRRCGRSGTVGGLGRGRAGQGHHVRRSGHPRTGTGCGALCCSASTAADRRRVGPTRTRCPVKPIEAIRH